METNKQNQSKKRKHAIVTGGGQGIGAAIVNDLYLNGMNVTILGRRLEVMAVIASKDIERINAIPANITDVEQIKFAMNTARDRFGLIDVLVNNAGQALSASFLNTDISLWQQMIDVNLNGTMICTKEALPDMLTQKWGRIINIASTAGKVGYSYVSAYCAAKHGVIGLTRALALELAKTGITVNAVCPGYTETEIFYDSVKKITEKTNKNKEEITKELIGLNPSGCLIQPEEIANIVTWLCKPESCSIIGQSISVSGGEVMT